jgi:hypothetical protein
MSPIRSRPSAKEPLCTRVAFLAGQRDSGAVIHST